MALTFPRVPFVVGPVGDEEGEPVTSTQLAVLSQAVNARLRSGVGDGTWRIVWYYFNLWRQVRNPGGLAMTAFPSQAEFMEFYQHLDPSLTTSTWPVTEPGEPEGANLGNPMMAFIAGNPGVESEDYRISGPDGPDLWLGGSAPGTPSARWHMGKVQRGVYDPATGQQNVPAFKAAESYFRIVSTAQHHKSYGGFLPVPELLGDCGDETESQDATPKYRFVFNPLREGLPVKTYTGACPPDAPGRDADNIVYIARMPIAYYIIFQSGQVDRLPTADYIEGPYEGGGVLQRPDGGQLARLALNQYIKGYRGADSQRDPDNFDLSEIAFDFERFFASQYHLSPSIGHVTGEDVTADYPLYELSANAAAGTYLTHAQSGTTSHAYATGFVLGGCLITATGLLSSVQLECISGTTVLATVTIGPGDASQITVFDNAGTPNALRFRLATAASFSPGGQIRIEASEILDYKPQIHDAYLVLRLSSTTGDFLSHVDGRGPDNASAREYSDNYFSNGMILNGTAAALPLQGIFGINDNPVFDAARAYTRDHVRITNRKQFIGYEVADGKSILYFKRYAFGSDNQEVDTFHNIAPAIAAVSSGSIRAGYTYVVRGGSIFYPTPEQATTAPVVAYADGEMFTGILGATEFDLFASAPTALVYEYEGIRAVAPPKDVTNEWLMFTQFKVYHPSDTSQWSTGGYSDYFAWSNRCHFYSPTINRANKPDLVRHFQFGMEPLMSPEAPSGYNFASGSNRFTYSTEANRIGFYRSCQIYQPDDEIESATVLQEGGIEIVKLVFKTRFQHCDEAPAAISRDLSTWNVDNLRAEPYRTTENGLREYLIYQDSGLNAIRGKVGDTGAESPLWTFPDEPYGNVFPHFFFTHLVPEPYEDDNDTIDESHDTRCVADALIQVETYVRAMCEGYVDGATTAAYGCRTGIAAMFDYTFENLCYDAFGGRWINTLSTLVRPDKPQGFGPLPNTIMYAEIYNQLAACLNLLDKARIMLPMRLQVRFDSYEAETSVTADWSNGADCVSSGTNKGIWSGTPPAPGTLIQASDYFDDVSVRANSSGGLNSSDQCDGIAFKVRSTKTNTTYKFSLVDPLSINAVAGNLRELIETDSTGFIAVRTEATYTPKKIQVADSVDAEGCCFDYQMPCPGFFYDGGLGYGWKFDAGYREVLSCGLYNSGSLAPNNPGSGDFFVGRSSGGATCANSSGHLLSLSPLGDDPVVYVRVPLV